MVQVPHVRLVAAELPDVTSDGCMVSRCDNLT
jgi:hypothetical protein